MEPNPNDLNMSLPFPSNKTNKLQEHNLNQCLCMEKIQMQLSGGAGANTIHLGCIRPSPLKFYYHARIPLVDIK